MTTLYRPAVGTFADAMRRVVEVDRSTLLSVISEQVGIAVTEEQLSVEPYAYDSRNKWNTHIVSIDGQAVGYTNAILTLCCNS